MKKTLKPTILALSLFVLGGVFSSPTSACSKHDHLCTYHALGTPTTSYDVKDQTTRLVIYAKATDTSHGDTKTDFDNHVLLPTTTTTHDWIGAPTTESTGPFINSRTSFGQANPSDVGEWETPQTKGAHVYGSQYQVIFNKNTAQAIHTGDLNGGEKGNTPYQSGCPAYEGKANCEAVVITGNVPSGTYQQHVQMFNFHNVDNPKAEIEIGAWATGQGVLISDTHLDSTSSNFIEANRRRSELINQGTSEIHGYTLLEGHKSKTPEPINYHFYNRGFDAHAQGVTSWDHNTQYHTRYGQQYTVLNKQTGNKDVLQDKFTKTSHQKTSVNAEGKASTETIWTPEHKTTHKLGTQYCSNGSASVRCDSAGARVVTDSNGNFTATSSPKPIDPVPVESQKGTSRPINTTPTNSLIVGTSTSTNNTLNPIINTQFPFNPMCNFMSMAGCGDSFGSRAISTTTKESPQFTPVPPNEQKKPTPLNVEQTTENKNTSNTSEKQPEGVKGKQNITCGVTEKVECTLAQYVFLKDNGLDSEGKPIPPTNMVHRTVSFGAVNYLKKNDHTGIDFQAQNGYFTTGKIEGKNYEQLPKVRALVGGRVFIPKPHKDNSHGMVGIITESINGKKVQINYLHMVNIDYSLDGQVIEKGTVLGRQGGRGFGNDNQWSGHLHMEFIELKGNVPMTTPLPFLNDCENTSRCDFAKYNKDHKNFTILNPKGIIEEIDKNYDKYD